MLFLEYEKGKFIFLFFTLLQRHHCWLYVHALHIFYAAPFLCAPAYNSHRDAFQVDLILELMSEKLPLICRFASIFFLLLSESSR